MATRNLILFSVLLISLSSQKSLVWGHGRLIEPASRNAAGKLGFNIPINYNQNEQNCGGVGVQWSPSVGGKCGVCGDAYNGPQPHVYPGIYATGVITKIYTAGQTIQAKVDITANHKGWFEFRLGKLDTAPITQGKLTHLLKLTNGETRWYLPSAENGEFTVDVQLPAGVSCDHCVFQWWWTSGNNWGCDSPNDCGVGKGPVQETYSNCADIKIVSSGAVTGAGTGVETAAQTTSAPITAETTYPESEEETEEDAQQQIATISTITPKESGQSEVQPTDKEPENPNRPLAKSTIVAGCHGVGEWEDRAEMNKWCYDNCSRGYCPPSHCECAFISS